MMSYSRTQTRFDITYTINQKRTEDRKEISCCMTTGFSALIFSYSKLNTDAIFQQCIRNTGLTDA